MGQWCVTVFLYLSRTFGCANHLRMLVHAEFFQVALASSLWNHNRNVYLAVHEDLATCAGQHTSRQRQTWERAF